MYLHGVDCSFKETENTCLKTYKMKHEVLKSIKHAIKAMSVTSKHRYAEHKTQVLSSPKV